MTPQKDFFQLPGNIHYLNCAAKSPMLKKVEEAGIAGIRKRRNPSEIRPDDFFRIPEETRRQFSRLVNCKPEQVALIPSVSYGMSTVIHNFPVNHRKQVITVSDEFPSSFYNLQRWCRENGKELKCILPPKSTAERGLNWNQRILESIDNDTIAVVLSSVHWTDGTWFDLDAIGIRCKEAGALFIVDGTQSVGALPMDVAAYRIDALICASYKWLLGPYSLGVGYFGDFFNNGKPLEEVWLNKTNAHDFAGLTSYVDDYKPGAARYNMGESSNFILVPMLQAALTQILEWKVNSIQEYCRELTRPLATFLKENGFGIEDEAYRAQHMFGFLLPESVHPDVLFEELNRRNVVVSKRNNAIRVSPHLYNSSSDIEALRDVLEATVIQA